MLGSAVLGSFYLASATAQTPGMPPPLPVGRKAVLVARSGIARSNATRSNYVYPDITVLLTKYRYPEPPQTVDVTDWVRTGTLRVTQAINDEPDTCGFTLKPELPAVHMPEVGDEIAVGMATEAYGPDCTGRRIAAGVEFGGTVIVKQHERRPANGSPWIAIQCQDWQWFFDAQLVNYAWPAQSASLTIVQLLQYFVNYSELIPRASVLQFSTDYVPPDLPSCPAFEAINWRPTQVLRHLVTKMQGGFYIDARRQLHIWANGPEPQQSPPRNLTNYLPTLKTFRHTVDAAQVRKRVLVEGRGTTTLVDLPAGLDQGIYTGGVPVEDAEPFVSAAPVWARLGSQWVEVQVTHPLQNPVENPYTAHVIGAHGTGGDMPAADGWMMITDYPPFLGRGPGAGIEYATYPAGWIKVGEQLVRYEQAAYNPVNGAWPAHAVYLHRSAYPFGGAIAPLKVGETVTWVDWIDVWEGDPHEAGNLFTDDLWLKGPKAARAGTPLVLRPQAWGQDANQPWAVHLPPMESLVQDGRYGYPGGTGRAQDDIGFFRMPLTTADWETEDWNARPGRQQVILLTAPDPVAAALMIMNVELSFPLKTLAPRRQCTARLVKPSTVLDVLLTGGSDAD